MERLSMTGYLTNRLELSGSLANEIKEILPTGHLDIEANGDYDVAEYGDITVAVPEPIGAILLTENGRYNVADYAEALVSTPVPTGEIELTSNGEHNVAGYASALVDVHPSGSISITENGTHDVSDYAEAVVDVEPTAPEEIILWENPKPGGNVSLTRFVIDSNTEPQYTRYVMYWKYQNSHPNTDLGRVELTYHDVHLPTQVSPTRYTGIAICDSSYKRSFRVYEGGDDRWCEISDCTAINGTAKYNYLYIPLRICGIK